MTKQQEWLKLLFDGAPIYLIRNRVRLSTLVTFEKPMVFVGKQADFKLIDREGLFVTKIVQAMGQLLPHGLPQSEVIFLHIEDLPEDCIYDLHNRWSVFFGVSPATHFFNLPNTTKYQVQKVDGVSLLWADPLSDIYEDAEKKRLFWKALKELLK